MEDRSGKVCETIHILGSNPHPEARCLEHDSVNDSVGAWDCKVGQYGNSLGVKVNEYYSS